MSIEKNLTRYAGIIVVMHSGYAYSTYVATPCMYGVVGSVTRGHAYFSYIS